MADKDVLLGTYLDMFEGKLREKINAVIAKIIQEVNGGVTQMIHGINKEGDVLEDSIVKDFIIVKESLLEYCSKTENAVKDERATQTDLSSHPNTRNFSLISESGFISFNNDGYKGSEPVLINIDNDDEDEELSSSATIEPKIATPCLETKPNPSPETVEGEDKENSNPPSKKKKKNEPSPEKNSDRYTKNDEIQCKQTGTIKEMTIPDKLVSPLKNKPPSLCKKPETTKEILPDKLVSPLKNKVLSPCKQPERVKEIMPEKLVSPLKNKVSASIESSVEGKHSFGYGDIVWALWDQRWYASKIHDAEKVPKHHREELDRLYKNSNSSDYHIVEFFVDGTFSKVHKSRVEVLGNSTAADKLRSKKDPKAYLVAIGELKAREQPQKTSSLAA